MDVVHVISIDAHSPDLDDVYYWALQNCNKFKVTNNPKGDRILFKLNSIEEALVFKLRWSHVL